MLNPAIGERRSAIEIVRDILSLCNGNDVNKTAIMYRSNLSYIQLRKYLSMLSGQGLLDKNVDGQFHTTKQGQKTLKQASSLIKTLWP